MWEDVEQGKSTTFCGMCLVHNNIGLRGDFKSWAKEKA